MKTLTRKQKIEILEKAWANFETKCNINYCICHELDSILQTKNQDTHSLTSIEIQEVFEMHIIKPKDTNDYSYWFGNEQERADALCKLINYHQNLLDNETTTN